MWRVIGECSVRGLWRYQYMIARNILVDHSGGFDVFVVLVSSMNDIRSFGTLNLRASILSSRYCRITLSFAKRYWIVDQRYRYTGSNSVNRSRYVISSHDGCFKHRHHIGSNSIVRVRYEAMRVS